MAAGALNAWLAVRAARLDYTSVPFCDQWPGTLAWYARLQAHPLAAFWEWHNEHRLVVPRLVFWADMRLAGGVNLLGLVASFVLCGAIVWVIGQRAAPEGGWRRIAASGLAACFGFSWIQYENFTSAFQCQWYLLDLFVLLAFAAIAAARRAASPERLVALSCGLAVLAALSMSNGVLTFPLLLAASLAWRLGGRAAALIVATGVATAALYFSGAPPGHAGPGPLIVLLTYPVASLEYAFRYLGAPLFLAVHWQGAPKAALAVVAGAVLCLITAAAAILALRRPVAVPEFLLFSLYVVLSSGATAAGRLTINPMWALSSRYTTNTLLMLALLGLFAICNVRAQPWRTVAAGGFALLAALFTARQVAMARADPTMVYGRRLAGLALRAGVYDSAYLAGISYDDPPFLRGAVAHASASGESIFGVHAPGLPSLADHPAAQSFCAGAIEEVANTGTQGVVVVRGWARSRHATQVQFFDANGMVTGAGIFGVPRNRFIGFARAAPAALIAYGAGSVPCRLNGKGPGE